MSLNDGHVIQPPTEKVQADGQKTVKECHSELENPEVKGRILIPQISGFKMARLVCLLTFLSLSCSYNLSPTTAQKEQKKFERFKIAPKEVMIYSGSAFLGYGIGKHFANLKLKD
jgi:hypothetical protein